MSGVNSTELDRLAEAHREAQGPEQPALFDEPHNAAVVSVERSRGRPPGSKNLRTEAYAALLIREAGEDPLRIATRIAAENVLDEDVVIRLARTWGCSRHDAVKLWAQVNRDAMPYLHQTLPKAVILNPGDPQGERVLLDLGDGDYRDVTPEDDAEAA